MIAKVLRWGNSYGIRLSKEDAEREGLREGQEIVIEIKAREGGKIDLLDLPSFNLGGETPERHDEYIAEAVLDEHKEKRRRYDASADKEA